MRLRQCIGTGIARSGGSCSHRLASAWASSLPVRRNMLWRIRYFSSWIMSRSGAVYGPRRTTCENRGRTVGHAEQPSSRTGMCGPRVAPQRGQYGRATSASSALPQSGHRLSADAAWLLHAAHTSGRTRSARARTHVRAAVIMAPAGFIVSVPL